MGNGLQDEIDAALAAAEREEATPTERVERLVEIAMELRQRSEHPDEIRGAVKLYRKALEICPQEPPLLRARTTFQMATALQAVPTADPRFLEEAIFHLERARPILDTLGSPEEVAEVDLNLGLILQSLAGAGRRKVADAISAHQSALRVFRAETHPKKFAILQNNLATAFLSLPKSDERSRKREALAMGAFEEGLRVANFVDHPAEYAMLQNNLGNVLQYASSNHTAENNRRALEAYDEALRVRTLGDLPVAHADTITNKANCLVTLHDDPKDPKAGSRQNVGEAIRLLRKASKIFREHGDDAKAKLVEEALSALRSD